ncbi:MAG: alkaline phosphatase D family protein [Bacteroidota bacterium]
MRYLFHCLFLFCSTNLVSAQTDDHVYFTNGFKLGELTDSSVMIWTRLCRAPSAVPIYHQQKPSTFRHPLDFDNDMPVDQMDGAVPGAFGQLQIQLTATDTIILSNWEYVSAYCDYTFKQYIGGLLPSTEFQVEIRGRKREGAPVSTITGAFTTSPAQDEIVPVVFTSSTCQYFWSYDDPVRGFRLYDSMLDLAPDFHCQTGDYIYYDKPGPMAYTIELARHKWHAMNSWPSLREFYLTTPLYIQKDDHDLLRDDASPYSQAFGELSFSDGWRIWKEQTPIAENSFRTFRWGRDLQIWLVEGREFRSNNRSVDGPDKSIWGEEQKSWFRQSVMASDASFKLLISPTPVVGPDRNNKSDNHANSSFATEGAWLREFLVANNMFVINGDRHWQYVARDPVTGLMEFSQGPSSDVHAQGWDPKDLRPEHQFLRVAGGFLATSIFRENGQPVIEFIHYDVAGRVVHRERIEKDW